MKIPRAKFKQAESIYLTLRQELPMELKNVLPLDFASFLMEDWNGKVYVVYLDVDSESAFRKIEMLLGPHAKTLFKAHAHKLAAITDTNML